MKRKIIYKKLNLNEFVQSDQPTTDQPTTDQPTVEKERSAAKKEVKKICSFFLKNQCKKGEKCQFLHAKEKKKLICFKFQKNKCPFSDAECDFYHNVEELKLQLCKFGLRCNKENCILTHKTIYCKFGKNCKNDKCLFEHTCKYNSDCKKKTCIFYHDEQQSFNIAKENFPNICNESVGNNENIINGENIYENKFTSVLEKTNPQTYDANNITIHKNHDMTSFLNSNFDYNFLNITFSYE